MNKAVVLLSGGLNSAVALAQLLHTYPACEAHVLHASYGNEKQFSCAVDIATSYNVGTFYKVDMYAPVPVELSCTIKKPAPQYDFTVGNYMGVLLNNAIGLAIALECDTVVTGINENSSPSVRDNPVLMLRTEWFAESVTQSPFHMYNPLRSCDSYGVVSKGNDLGVPFNQTWSCAIGSDIACGECRACKLRLDAFKQVGLLDPIKYKEYSK